MHEMFMAFVAWMAQQERIRIQERVLAGLARARDNGTKSGRMIGRPRASERDGGRLEAEELAVLVHRGMSLRTAAKQFGVSRSTIRREMKRRPSLFVCTPDVGKNGVPVEQTEGG